MQAADMYSGSCDNFAAPSPPSPRASETQHSGIGGSAPRTAARGSYRAERLAAQRSSGRAPRTMSQERAVAARAAVLEKPAATVGSTRGLRPSPWAPAPPKRPLLAELPLTAAPPPSPSPSPKGWQQGSGKDMVSDSLVADKPELLLADKSDSNRIRRNSKGPPLDGSGRRTASPQQALSRCSSASSTSSQCHNKSSQCTRTVSASPSRGALITWEGQYVCPSDRPASSSGVLANCREPCRSRSASVSSRNPTPGSSRASTPGPEGRCGRSQRSHQAAVRQRTDPGRSLSASRHQGGAVGALVDNGRALSASRRNAQPKAKGMRRAAPGSEQRKPWPAAGHCQEALKLVAPLREALCTALGHHKSASLGPPVRSAASGAPHVQEPSARDVQKLSDAISASMGALASLLFQLPDQEPSACSMPCMSSGEAQPLQEQLAQLQQEREQGRQQREHSAKMQQEIQDLQLQEVKLDATAVESADLESVVRQLRSRVSEMEAQESRVADLRQECRSLRGRLTQLVATTVDEKSLQEERCKLIYEVELEERRLRQKSFTPMLDCGTQKSFTPTLDCGSMQTTPPDFTGDGSTAETTPPHLIGNTRACAASHRESARYEELGP